MKPSLTLYSFSLKFLHCKLMNSLIDGQFVRAHNVTWFNATEPSWRQSVCVCLKSVNKVSSPIMTLVLNPPVGRQQRRGPATPLTGFKQADVASLCISVSVLWRPLQAAYSWISPELVISGRTLVSVTLLFSSFYTLYGFIKVYLSVYLF